MKTPQIRKIGKWTLPDECIACGAEDSYVRELTSTEKCLRGETFTVQHHHWKCSACGVGILGDAEMDEAMHATVAAYQQAHGLLTASELLAARSRMKWTQETLAAKSGLGVATIKRLELGSVVQTQANDALLRATLGPATLGATVFFVSEFCAIVRENDERAWTSQAFDKHPAANSNTELALAG